jgi:hypothetical protein
VRVCQRTEAQESSPREKVRSVCQHTQQNAVAIHSSESSLHNSRNRRTSCKDHVYQRTRLHAPIFPRDPVAKGSRILGMGGVRTTRGTKCQHTSLNIWSTSAQGLYSPQDCRQHSHHDPRVSPQAHKQRLTGDTVSGLSRITDTRSGGFSRIANDQYRAAKPILGNFEVAFLYTVSAPRPDLAQIKWND